MPVAINEKGQLEVNGQAITNVNVNGKDQLTLARNEKGQLEVNGKAITNIDVTGKEKVSDAKKKLTI